MASGEIEGSILHHLMTEGVSFSPAEIGFLVNTISSCEEHVMGSVISLVVFGSVVKGGAVKGVSDFDLLIVLSDSVNKRQLRDLREKVSTLCREHGIADSESKDFEGIPRMILKESGMFVSYIICRASDIHSKKFHRIFDTNPMLTWLIVPSNIVVGNILRESKTVYGTDLTSSLDIPNPTKLDILRSLVMNELLAALSVFYHPLTRNSTKLAMEASKWSIYNASYLITGESKSLNESIQILSNEGLADDHFVHLNGLRKNYIRDFHFELSALKSIARTHLFLISEFGKSHHK